MTRVHILTPGFTTPNGVGFLFPILYHQKALQSIGVDCHVFNKIGPELTECDVVIVESKFFMSGDMNVGSTAPPLVVDLLRSFREKAGRLLWFDSSDSTGTLQTAAIPLVDRYYKNQMLRDRTLYQKPLYGERLHADFNHRNYGIEDEQPVTSEPLDDDGIAKLGVSWHTGLADRSLWGPLRAVLYRRLGWRMFLQQPSRWTQPGIDRDIAVSSHFNTSHTRATVRFHREMARDILGGETKTKRIGRRAYLREMERTKIVVAPFSYGEITFRDFEACIAGCLLVKPDMEHVLTWPDIYQKGVTYVGYSWNMEDLAETLEEIETNYSDYIRFARAAQSEYRKAIVGDEAREGFANRFAGLVQGG